MIRSLLLLTGCLLLILSGSLLFTRPADVVADSTAVIVQQRIGDKYTLTQYDFAHRQRPIFSSSASIYDFIWMPSGEWVLVMTNDNQSNKIEIWRVDYLGRHTQRLYQLRDWDLLDEVRVSPARDEFVFIEQDVNVMTAPAIIHHIAISGEVLGEYPLEGQIVRDWTFRWQDADHIYLFRPLAEDGFVVDFKQAEVQAVQTEPTDQWLAAITRYNVSPNEKWRIVPDALSLTLNNYAEAGPAVWRHASNTLYFHGLVGWSPDSQQIAVNAEEVPLGRTFGASNIYITGIDSPMLKQLTDDERLKGFVPDDTSYEYSVTPFSPKQQWILFSNHPDPLQINELHAVRTDGSRQEITNLVPPGKQIFAAQWVPNHSQPHFAANLWMLTGLISVGFGLGLIFQRGRQDSR